MHFTVQTVEFQPINHVEAGKNGFLVLSWTKMVNLSCSLPSSTVQRMIQLIIDDLGSWKDQSEVFEGERWQFWVKCCQILKCDISVNIGATELIKVPLDASDRELSNGMLGVDIAGLQQQLCTLQCKLLNFSQLIMLRLDKMVFSA